MKRIVILLVSGFVGLATGHQASAQDGLAPCQPGWKYVEETVMKEQVRFCCKVVPNIKTKWVHCMKPDAICVPVGTSLGLGHACGTGCCPGGACSTGSCPSQTCLNCKIVCRNALIKKQIEYCDGQKCVVERIVELVPCRTYRMVPITAQDPIVPPERIAPPMK